MGLETLFISLKPSTKVSVIRNNRIVFSQHLVENDNDNFWEDSGFPEEIETTDGYPSSLNLQTAFQLAALEV